MSKENYIAKARIIHERAERARVQAQKTQEMAVQAAWQAYRPFLEAETTARIELSQALIANGQCPVCEKHECDDITHIVALASGDAPR